MKRIVGLAASFLSFFKQELLTNEEVLACIPPAWICTIHGQDSLRKRLENKFNFTDGEFGDAELYYRLKGLEAKGLIELEVRQWQNSIDKKFYLHQQCRISRTENPNARVTRDDQPDVVPA